MKRCSTGSCNFLVDPGDVGGGERAQRHAPSEDRLPFHDSSLAYRTRRRGGPDRQPGELPTLRLDL